MPLTGLTFRTVLGVPLSGSLGDKNLRLIRDFCNSLEQLFGVVLNPNGTLKNGAVGASAVLADGVVTLAKLAADARIPAGTVVAYGGTTPPSGWLECDGSAVSRTTYAALFSAISDKFGVGDGSTTFNLPNVRRRSIMGSGGTGTATLDNTVGSIGGAETHALSEAEMPAHSHNINENPDVTDMWGFPIGAGDFGHSSGTQLKRTALSLETKGSSAAHNNLPPLIVMMMIIKV